MKKLMCGVLIVVMMLSLVACGNKLSGTYKTEEKLGSYMSYTFDGDKVTCKLVAAGITAATLEGTYKIDGDKITLTWNSDEIDGALAGELDFTKTDDGIKIGVLELKKA